ncbi:hypothetical protein J2Z44_002401 [Clostridium punense]|uniref:Bacteriocin n=1 Tax=Clostridium punense TaxID=1054297 RepID=A0ABS4K481_9CLOT|nr:MULTISPECIES: hypothetical protein [Clostridium]EQB86214.1 hypothetical protein M918_14845 [Clostridium sp. BL8]MBP2022578.1 hypothetical protein [Clostridium punense]
MTDTENLRAILNSPEGRELVRRLNNNGNYNAAALNNYNYSCGYPGGNCHCNTGNDDFGLLLLGLLLFCGCGWCCW